MVSPQKRGFILILVIAMLGVLSVLAFQLLAQADTSRRLALHDIRRTQAGLLANSGVEWGRAYLRCTLGAGIH